MSRLAELEQRSLGENGTQSLWVDVDSNDNVLYTSLIGVSVVGLRPNSVSTFSVPYEYMYMDCALYMRENYSTITAFFRANEGIDTVPYGWPRGEHVVPASSPNLLFVQNFTLPWSTTTWFESSFFLVNVRNSSENSTKTIYYGTKHYDRKIISVYKCSPHSLIVEARLICNSASCSVQQMRHAPELQGEPDIYGGQPYNVVHNREASGYFFDYFPSRLTQVMNAYWEASRWILATPRRDPFALSSMNATSGSLNSHLDDEMNSTTAISTRQIPIYRANITWVLMLVLCSGTLLLLGIVNVFVAFQTTVPDIFGYVSSLTRDNPHIQIPEGGSTLDGTQRSRLIRGLKVQLADLQEGEEVGHVALKSLGGNGAKVARLQRGRMYT
ncbi:hypothetical protein CC86DRAFT_377328 [Ophiobolus disseminans]|uniref:Uncharacterized protein n=1 Tax=Ophiobolus disseminans TaxID=1469910 RepID=A0A6A7AG51_9PLEO|nr:hypothetical protein CC86DRAFT_377328 [Ophiobolus disseminans]